MNFEEVRLRLRQREREGDVGVQTDPDAFMYLSALRGLSLVDLASTSGVPLCVIVQLSNRPMILDSVDAEAIAVALDAGVSDFTSEDRTSLLPNVSFALLERLSGNLQDESESQVLERQFA